MVHWLGLSAYSSVAQVQSLVRELRSCKPRSVAKIYIYVYLCLLMSKFQILGNVYIVMLSEECRAQNFT